MSQNVASFFVELLHLHVGFRTTHSIPDRMERETVLPNQMGWDHGGVTEHARLRPYGWLLHSHASCGQQADILAPSLACL